MTIGKHAYTRLLPFNELAGSRDFLFLLIGRRAQNLVFKIPRAAKKENNNVKPNSRPSQIWPPPQRTPLSPPRALAGVPPPLASRVWVGKTGVGRKRAMSPPRVRRLCSAVRRAVRERGDSGQNTGPSVGPSAILLVSVRAA